VSRPGDTPRMSGDRHRHHDIIDTITTSIDVLHATARSGPNEGHSQS
jgi:hypothetical protein